MRATTLYNRRKRTPLVRRQVPDSSGGGYHAQMAVLVKAERPLDILAVVQGHRIVKRVAEADAGERDALWSRVRAAHDAWSGRLSRRP